MSKNKLKKSVKEKTVDFEKNIMAQVNSNEIIIKPKWYFVVGSLFSIIGFTSLSISSVFLVNIMIFLLKKHGQMGQWKLETMLNSFPLWIPISALLGMIFGIWLLRKYDFSYKNNFLIITAGFVASIILTGFIINQLGLNSIWSQKGFMKKFYQNINSQREILPKRQGQGKIINYRSNDYNLRQKSSNI